MLSGWFCLFLYFLTQIVPDGSTLFFEISSAKTTGLSPVFLLSDGVYPSLLLLMALMY